MQNCLPSQTFVKLVAGKTKMESATVEDSATSCISDWHPNLLFPPSEPGNVSSGALTPLTKRAMVRVAGSHLRTRKRMALKTIWRILARDVGDLQALPAEIATDIAEEGIAVVGGSGMPIATSAGGDVLKA
jgi:hypothetical protein